MFRSNSYSKCCVLLLMFCVLSIAMPASVEAQKVGSPEWKREFDRKMAEGKKRHEEIKKKLANRKASGSSSGSTTNRFGHKSQPLNTKSVTGLGYKTEKLSFSTSSAAKSKSTAPTKSPSKKASQFKATKTPEASFKACRAAVKRATSYEQLLPYLSEIQKSNYEASKSWGSKFDSLGHAKEIGDKIVRYDGYKIIGDKAFVHVIRKTGGTHSYRKGTFKFKGEGTQWKLEEYSDGSLGYGRMPKE